jgi:hypothetical protein
MKAKTGLLGFLLACSLGMSAAAMSGGSSASQGGLWHGQSLTKPEYVYEGGPRWLSFGILWADEKRGIAPENSDFTSDWEIRHIMGYAGADVLPWLTLQAGAGESDLSIDGDSRDGDLEWMVGAQCRLIDYLALDPIVGEEPYWLGVEASVQYLDSSSEGPMGDVEWNELFGAVTISLTSRPERYGFLNRLGIYVGPAFSTVSAEQNGQEFEEDQAYGYVAGLTLNPSDNVSLKIELQDFDSTSFGVALGFHF